MGPGPKPERHSALFLVDMALTLQNSSPYRHVHDVRSDETLNQIFDTLGEDTLATPLGKSVTVNI